MNEAIEALKTALRKAREEFAEWERQYTTLEVEFNEKVRAIPYASHTDVVKLERALCELQGHARL